MTPRMEKDRNEMTKRILHFTLEILHLLTGEDYTIVKKTSGECVAPSSHLHESGGQSRARGPITEPPPHSLIHEEKILELIHRITELLTREVPIRCQDVAVYFSMEEWEYVEGHKDLYQDIMEDPRTLTSQGNCNKNWRNSPLRLNCKVEDEEIMERSSAEGKEIMERSSGEDGEITEHSSEEDGEIMERSSDLLTHNVHPGLYRTDLLYNHEEPSPDQPHIVTTRTGQDGRTMFQCDECKIQFTKLSTLLTHRRIHPGEKPNSCLLNEESCRDKSQMGEKTSPSSPSGKGCTDTSNVDTHVKSNTGKKPFICSECGKCFKAKSYLAVHERKHKGKKSFKCSECGKCVSTKSGFIIHKRIHKGEKPFTCSECGKCFTDKSSLLKHEKIHTGEKPYSCPECGKCFITKGKVRDHQRIHRAKKPCVKEFMEGVWRVHSGEKPYSCSQCGKCFTDKSNLDRHMIIHTGERPC
ncbi:zinc finger protein 664-like [Hyla sarda]|uniref:zinc finger protein 664-like n=1 Tax=Hyla sarda TaxID=327740 RepID=UPI0024C34DCC|nr:zinc finger protein 664-like [Hyla sarda]